jgi:toxin YoeB
MTSGTSSTRSATRCQKPGSAQVWDESAWADYVWWQAQDRRVLRRVSQLTEDIRRNGNEGFGKPEPLKHGFQGYWSRRIAACRYHYER